MCCLQTHDTRTCRSISAAAGLSCSGRERAAWAFAARPSAAVPPAALPPAGRFVEPSLPAAAAAPSAVRCAAPETLSVTCLAAAEVRSAASLLASATLWPASRASSAAMPAASLVTAGACPSRSDAASVALSTLSAAARPALWAVSLASAAAPLTPSAADAAASLAVSAASASAFSARVAAFSAARLAQPDSGCAKRSPSRWRAISAAAGSADATRCDPEPPPSTGPSACAQCSLRLKSTGSAAAGRPFVVQGRAAAFWLQPSNLYEHNQQEAHFRDPGSAAASTRVWAQEAGTAATQLQQCPLVTISGEVRSTSHHEHLSQQLLDGRRVHALARALVPIVTCCRRRSIAGRLHRRCMLLRPELRLQNQRGNHVTVTNWRASAPLELRLQNQRGKHADTGQIFMRPQLAAHDASTSVHIRSQQDLCLSDGLLSKTREPTSRLSGDGSSSSSSCCCAAAAACSAGCPSSRKPGAVSGTLYCSRMTSAEGSAGDESTLRTQQHHSSGSDGASHVSR